MQRHHGLKDSAKGMTGQFQPACNADGTFEKTQCHCKLNTYNVYT